jgi:hypothetical protein
VLALGGSGAATAAMRGAAWRRLATICEAAGKVEPYIRADGTRIWSLMQLERRLRPEAYGRHRGGYLDRQIPAVDDRQSGVLSHR